MTKMMEKHEQVGARKRIGAMLKFMPNLIGLCGRLMVDSRVAKTDKALFASAVFYALAPLDFIPDLLPFIGQVDDAYLVALTLLRLINHTDESVVRRHWRGGGDPVLLAHSLAGLAPLILPKRISRVISAKIELAPLFKLCGDAKQKTLLVEQHDDETKVVLRTV